MLKVENLEVAYGGIQALRGISFEVPEGRIVTLIGANGAGKSTTLRSSVGLVRVRSGKIIFDGNDITNQPTHKTIAAGIATVPEGRRIFASMSVYFYGSANSAAAGIS